MAKAKLQPGDEGYDWSTYTPDTSVEDAKAFLAPYQAQENRARILEENRPRPEHSTLRNITDAGETIAGPAMFGAMVPSPASPFLAGGSAALFGAAGLRKLLAPEEDESRLGGAIDVGLSTLPYLRQAAGLVKGGRAAASAVETGNPEMVSNVISRARTLMGGGETRGRSAQQSGWPLGKSSASPSMEPSLPHSYATPKPHSLQGLREAAARDAQTSEIIAEGHGPFGGGGVDVGKYVGPSERLVPREEAPLAAQMRERYGPSPAERNAGHIADSTAGMTPVERRINRGVAPKGMIDRRTGKAPVELTPDEAPVQAGELPESWKQFVNTPEKKLGKLSKLKRPSRARKVA